MKEFCSMTVRPRSGHRELSLAFLCVPPRLSRINRLRVLSEPPKPDETPRGVRNRSLIIRHFRRRTGRHRPVLRTPDCAVPCCLSDLRRRTYEELKNVKLGSASDSDQFRVIPTKSDLRKVKNTFLSFLDLTHLTILTPSEPLAPGCTYLQKKII